MSALDVAVELGPKGRRAAAWAVDWPGLERGGATPEEALTRLEAYRERYAPVARLARRGGEFSAAGDVRVVETYVGSGSTDFWGISFVSGASDEVAIDAAAFTRRLRLLAASWRHFDAVRASVSPTLRKGPRGGGRDREAIAGHVLRCEQDWARKVGVDPAGDVVADPGALAAHRDAFLRALRAHLDDGRRARSWSLPFLVRHSAFHVLDHAWEMQDRDLGAGSGPRPPA